MLWEVHKHVGKGRLSNGVSMSICEDLTESLLWVVVTPHSVSTLGSFACACSDRAQAEQICVSMNLIEDMAKTMKVYGIS